MENFINRSEEKLVFIFKLSDNEGFWGHLHFNYDPFYTRKSISLELLYINSLVQAILYYICEQEGKNSKIIKRAGSNKGEQGGKKQ